MCNCRDYFVFKLFDLAIALIVYVKVTVNIILHYISFFITIQRKRKKLVKLQIVIVPEFVHYHRNIFIAE